MFSDQLLANIKEAEGLRLEAYRDTLGYWTVGYGHKLAEGHDWTAYTVNPDTANGLLLTDLNAAYGDALRLSEWPALDTQCRQDAVTEIVFNMGGATWRKFLKTRAAISDQEWQAAHDNLLNSLWAKQVKEGRADRIADQLRTGTYGT